MNSATCATYRGENSIIYANGTKDVSALVTTRRTFYFNPPLKMSSALMDVLLNRLELINDINE